MSGLLWLCFTISGAAALALEVLWMRSAGLVLGATAPTAATVLACYFAGIGLGAAGARCSQQRPVRRYGLLELGAGLGAFWSLGIFWILASDPAQAGLAVAGPVGRITAVAIALLPATLCLGATLPAIALVGFALGEHHDTALAQSALQMAVAVRGGKAAVAGVILHTDQGSEYTATNFQAACGRVGIKQSMGRAGSALDNAVIESWHSTLEFELRELERFATRAQARVRVAAWIEEYNHHRRHSSLQMLSPVAYELRLTQQHGHPQEAAA